MRYRFIDKITSLTLDGEPRIEVAKTFDAGDDAFSGPSGQARVPESLLLELMAMTGGQLIFPHLWGDRLAFLLEVPQCRFDPGGGPGIALRALAAPPGAPEGCDGTGVVGAAA